MKKWEVADNGGYICTGEADALWGSEKVADKIRGS